MARILKRAPSTISREMQRNGPSGKYSCTFAQKRRDRRRVFCRAAPKLVASSALFAQVCALLKKKWSPEQIAIHLNRHFPNDAGQRVSYETIYNAIYNAIYAMPRGELRKDLIALMRRAQSKRMPRSRGVERRGKITDMVSVHFRPPEADSRLFPGHWESNLIKGKGNASAVGSLVERSSRLLILVHLPGPKPGSAATVLEAFTQKLRSIAQPMRQSLTHDQGSEMARHKDLAANTNIAVYFCDPHSPWQRGTNENTNGLVRQYLPKGTDLSGFSQKQLDGIADEINNRPRKTLNAHSLQSAFLKVSQLPRFIHRAFAYSAFAFQPLEGFDFCINIPDHFVLQEGEPLAFCIKLHIVGNELKHTFKNRTARFDGWIYFWLRVNVSARH